MPAGTVLTEPGAPQTRFCYVEAGEFEAFDPVTDARLFPSTIGPGQFVVEIGVLTRQASHLGIRAVADARVVAVPREALLSAMALNPEMSDIVVSVLAARRRAHLELTTTNLTILGPEADKAVRDVVAFAARNRLARPRRRRARRPAACRRGRRR